VKTKLFASLLPQRSKTTLADVSTGSSTVTRLALPLALVLLSIATACSSEKADYATEASSGVQTFRAPQGEAGKAAQSFAYNHFLQVEMASEFVEPRFARARDRCLQDTSLSCTLLSASINSNESEYGYAGSRAQLDVMLPGDKVDAFEEGLTERLPEEGEGDPKVAARSTSAEDVTREAANLDQQIQQLSDYRDRLVELSKRSNLTAAELIQVAGELSKTQSTLDQLLAQKNDVSARVSMQKITVYLSGRVTADPFRPIARVLTNSLDLFLDSVADALRFLIQVVPWLPVVAAGLFLVSWLWRRFRRSRAST
jgi:hypothetical protein